MAGRKPKPKEHRAGRFDVVVPQKLRDAALLRIEERGISKSRFAQEGLILALENKNLERVGKKLKEFKK